jgi:hypothetical protein
MAALFNRRTPNLFRAGTESLLRTRIGMKYRIEYDGSNPPKANARQSENGLSYECPACGAMVPYRDLDQTLAHAKPHATPEEAARHLRRH